MIRRFSVLALLLFAPILSAQVPAGLSGWYNMDEWCSGKFTGVQATFHPDRALKGLQRAAKCGIPIVFTYSRLQYTSNGTTHGCYVSSKHRALSDAWARALKPDTIKKYVASHTLIGLNVGDDYNATIWCGRKIPLSTAVADANYAKSKMPDAPIGVRIDPLAASFATGWKVDYMWAQWTGSPSKMRTWKSPFNWYNANAAKASKMGVGMFVGINAEDCYGSSSDRCSASRLAEWGSMAVGYAKNCGFFPWYYNTSAYYGAYRNEFEELIQLANSKSFTSCKTR